MTINLDTLRKTAEAATPGPWEASDRGIGYEVHDASGYELNSGMRETFTESDATHIATFDPETVLALLSRLEQAEQAVARVRSLCMTTDGDLICPDFDGNTVGDILRALDGHTKQLGGTPTGELADVCSCGKSYWPCTALDGDGRG